MQAEIQYLNMIQKKAGYPLRALLQFLFLLRYPELRSSIFFAISTILTFWSTLVQYALGRFRSSNVLELAM